MIWIVFPYVTISIVLLRLRIFDKFPAYGNICRIPTIEMNPNFMTDHFVVKVFYESSLEPISVCELWVQQMIINNTCWAFVEKL